MSSSEDTRYEIKDYAAPYPNAGVVNGTNNNMVDHAQLAQHHYAQAQLQQGTQNPVVARKPYDYGGNPLARIDTVDSARFPAFGGEFQPGLYRDTKERKFANPAPLGLCAFALTTFVLSLINVGTRGIPEPNIVVALAFGYGGLVQLLAGMWEMAVGNTFGATALSSYGGFWLSFAIILTPGGFNIVAAYKTGFDDAFGLFLFGWFIFTTLLLIATLKSTVAFFLLFFTLDMAFLFLALGYIYHGATAPQPTLIKIGGGFGLAAAFLAWYNALAGILDKSNAFFLIPVVHFPWSEKGREKREEKKGSVDESAGLTV